MKSLAADAIRTVWHDDPSSASPSSEPPVSDSVRHTDDACGVRFDSVTVAYPGAIALQDFSLTVAPGEVVALLGPSGSGKTTALRAVAGFVKPARGRVFIGPRDVTGLPPYQRDIGMVVQQYALFPHMRVFDNVAFGLRARRMARTTIARRVAECLAMVGMADYDRRYPRELSGGQQQRVAIARALAIEPKLLLLDEPLSALDAQLRSGMLNEIARLHGELPDLTILYVTHDQAEALTLADRIAVMNNSRLVDIGSAYELYSRPPSRFTAEFVGNANLLPVVVERYDETAGQAWVRLADGPLLATVSDPVAAGEQRLLCVRPHALSLERHPHCENAIEATLTGLQWRGTLHQLYLDLDGIGIRVDTNPLRTAPRMNSRLTLYFAPYDAVLLDAS